MKIGASHSSMAMHQQPAKSMRETHESSDRPVTSPGIDKKEPEKGVIRLLEQGHFKGVAEVRLRINFFEELTTRSAAEQDAAFFAGRETFDADVEDALTQLQSDLALTEDQAPQFNEQAGDLTTAINGIIDDFQANGDSDTAALAEGLQTEMGSFVTNLQTLLNSSEIDGILQAFSDSFATQVDALSEVFAATSNGLGELSEPQGNGAAYAKFLAILEGMQAESAPETTAETGSESATDPGTSIDIEV